MLTCFLLVCLRCYSIVFWHPSFPLENSVVTLLSIPLKLIIFFFFFFWLLLEFTFCLRCSIFYFVVSRCVSLFIFLKGFSSILESVAYCAESFMKHSHLFSWIFSHSLSLFLQKPRLDVYYIFSLLSMSLQNVFIVLVPFFLLFFDNLFTSTLQNTNSLQLLIVHC